MKFADSVKRHNQKAKATGFEPLSDKDVIAYNLFRELGPQKKICYVPSTTMHFSFQGKIMACAYNQKVILGYYPQASLRDIWLNSTELKELRRHIDNNDLTYGCKHCKHFIEAGKFSGLKPLVFDRYADTKIDAFPKVLEFEISTNCNLECVMCNGMVSSSVRANREKLPPLPNPYDDQFVEQIAEFIPHIEEAKFYGGEPTLIPQYHKIWDLILKNAPNANLFMITNGMTFNEKLRSILTRGNWDLAVSIDSTHAERVEAIRKNVKAAVLFRNIDIFSDIMRAKGLHLTLSFTLMRLNWMDFVDLIRFANDRDAHVYVSYLKLPERFAIWNLPADELSKMRKQLDSVQLPETTPIERFNARCFRDFLTYLEVCQNNNVKRAADEIISLEAGASFDKLLA